MLPIILLVAHTANILGALTDPFEFAGDQGPESNQTREKVFELVLPKEHLAKQQPDASEDLIQQAVEYDAQYGPTPHEIVPPELTQKLIEKQRKLEQFGFSEAHLQKILLFIKKYGSRKVFRFLNNTPSKFLSLDKTLPDHASQQGREFSMPILGSPTPLAEKDAFSLKNELLQALFTEETLSLAQPEEKYLNQLYAVDPDFLQELLGEEAQLDDLTAFCYPCRTDRNLLVSPRAPAPHHSTRARDDCRSKQGERTLCSNTRRPS